jgi:hypothetical protein
MMENMLDKTSTEPKDDNPRSDLIGVEAGLLRPENGVAARAAV